MNRKLSTFCCFLLLFLYFFLVFETTFHGPDEPIYHAYTASVIEDGDLNAVNRIYRNQDFYFPSGVMGISKTYNLADFHGHGGVLLWAPFYMYGKLAYSFVDELNSRELDYYGLERFTECLMSFSTIVFGLFVLLLTYMLCRIFFSDWISLFSTFVICFGTPFFYYLLFEPGNAQIVASLFSICSIWAVSYIIRMEKSHCFIYGLFFGICLAVKADLWPQLLFVFSFFGALLILKKATWKNIGFFLLGLTPACTLKIINDYIKYGTFHIGEIGVFSGKVFYLWETLFSSFRGYFYTAPILYICLAGFLLVAVHSLRKMKTFGNMGTDENRWRDFFIFILGAHVFIKIYAMSYDIAWGLGGVGARPLLTEFPVFVILYARILQAQKGFLRYCLFFVSIVLILWNMLIISEYVANIYMEYVVQAPKLGIRVRSFKNILEPLFLHKDLNLKLHSCLLPMLIVSGITFYVVMFSKKVHSPSSWCSRDYNSKSVITMLCWSAICLNISYAGITFSNIQNNRRNVEKLKAKGFFANAKILQNRDFEKRENVRAMNQMIKYFTLKGDQERAQRIKRSKEEMYGEDKL